MTLVLCCTTGLKFSVIELLEPGNITLVLLEWSLLSLCLHKQPFSWFSFMWCDSHVGVQNNGKMTLKFYIIIESIFFCYCSVHQQGCRDVKWEWLSHNIYKHVSKLTASFERSEYVQLRAIIDWLIIIIDDCQYDIKILKTTKEKIGAVAFLMACIMGCFGWFGQTTSPMCSYLQPLFNQQWAFWNRCICRFISLCLFTLSTFLIADKFFCFYFLLWVYNPNLP